MRSGGTEVKRIFGYIRRETEKAILLDIKSAHEDQCSEEWFPLSQTKQIFRAAFPGDLDYLDITMWIADKKNLLSYESPGSPPEDRDQEQFEENIDEYYTELDPEKDIPF